MAAGMAKVSRQMKEMGSRIRSAGTNATIYLTAGIAAVGTASLVAFAKVEKLEMIFGTMLGSAEAGKQMMTDLRDFATRTPFKLEGLANTAKMLLAFGIAADDIPDRLQKIGDVSAVAGVPIKDLGLIYGQVIAKGRLQSEELLQFAERGVPIMDGLVKMLGKTAAQVQEQITAGELSAEMFAKAFGSLSREGGIAFQAMAKQSTILTGLWSTFTDVVEDSGVTFGNTISKAIGLKKGLKSLTDGIKSYTKEFAVWAESNPELAKWSVYAGLAVAAIGPLLIGLGAFVSIAGFVASGIGAIAAAFMLLISPIALIIAAIAAVIGIGYVLVTRWDEIMMRLSIMLNPVKDAWSEFSNWVSSFFSVIGAAFSASIDSMIEKAKSLLSFLDPIIDFIGAGGSMGGATMETTSNENINQNANDSAAAMYGGKIPNNINVTGNIGVEASGGAKVKSANIGLNLGNNLATIQ